MTKASASAPAPPRPTGKVGSKDATRPRRSADSRDPEPSQRPGPVRVIAIANQKGGVGKSTTAVSLGAALADLGFRVLVVDLDPQGNASTGLGIRHEARATTVYDVVVGEAPLEGAVVKTQVNGLDAVPATIDLAGAEIELVSQFSRESRLKKALEPVRRGAYDFVFLDCPPSLGLLTVNALTAAEELIVPIQCEYYALEGLGQLLRNVNLVQQNINPRLRLSGIVMTMFDSRTKLSEQVVDEVRRFFGELVYDVIIPRTVRLSEAPGFGQPITVYDPRSRGAETYRELAREVADRPRPELPMPSLEDLSGFVVSPIEHAAARAPAGDIADPGAPKDIDEERDGSKDHQEGEPADAGAHSEAPIEGPPLRDGEPEREEDVETPSAEREVPAPAVVEAHAAAANEAPAAADEDLWEDDSGDAEAPEPPAPREAPGSSDRRVVVIDDDDDLDIKAAKEPLVGVRTDPEPDTQHEAVVPIGATLADEDAGGRRRWRLFRKGGDR